MQVMENLAVTTAPNHSDSPGKNSVKFKGKRSGPSVLGKTVPTVLNTTRGLRRRPRASGGT